MLLVNNMLELVTTNKFKKDLKRIQKRGYNLQKLHDILNTLRSNQATVIMHQLEIILNLENVTLNLIGY